MIRTRRRTSWRAPFTRWLTVAGEMAALALCVPLLAFALAMVGLALRGSH